MKEPRPSHLETHRSREVWVGRATRAEAKIATALAWLTAEPGDPAYREDPRTRLTEIYTALTGGD